VTSEERWKRLIFRWTTPKGFVAIVLFFILALLTEYLMVYSFSSYGLTDKFLVTFFTVNISPLFHLMPLGVIIVLVSSWTYLTKYMAVVPRRTSPTKKPLETRRRRHPRPRKIRLKSIRKFFERIDQAISSFFSKIATAILRIRGVSYLQKRLFFARAAVKSTATVLAVFVASALALYLLAHPKVTYDLAAGLHRSNPSFHGFVLKTIEVGKGMAQALSPIGWLASAIDNALRAVAPGFRNALEGFGAPIIKPMTKIDLLGRYIICQNVAAWVSAAVALAYGKYTSSLYRIRKPR
jgi:hypothetical protein